MLREKENQVSTGDMGSGTMEYILPYDTPLKPRCRPRYAVRMNEYPVEDNQYGCNCYVYEYEDINTHKMCKRLITNLPDEIFWEMVEFSQRSCSLMRKDEEHTDRRPAADYDDENGGWHSGVLDQAVYAQYRRSCEEDEPDMYDESILYGPLSNNPKSRNAQIRARSEIVDKATPQLSPLLRKTYEELFFLQKKEVDIADEEGVGSSAVTNRKNRLLKSMRDILIALGFIVPSKAELKAEKAAAEERNQRIDTEYSRQRKEAQEMELARQLTVLFYQENIPDRKALNEIEKELDDAA